LRPTGAAALTALLLTLGLLFSRHLEGLSIGATPPFDEGVYYESASALANGAHLGSQVFASQPPLFFDGLMLGWKLTGGGIAAMHGLVLIITLIGCALGYALVWPLAGTAGGLAAVALLGFAFSSETPAIAATIPSIVLGLAALAAGERASIRSAWGFAAGALVTAAVFVKLLALPFVVGLAALIVSRRLSRKALALMACGAVAVAAAVVVVHADDLMVIWKQAVGWHAGRRSAPDPTKIVRTAAEDTNLTWMLPALLVITAALMALNRPTSWRRWICERAAVLSVLVSGLLYFSQIDLNPPHLLLLSATLAVLAASSCPRGLLIPSAVVAAALAGTAVVSRPLLAGDNVRAMRDAAATIRASTTPEEAVVSDLPFVPLFADRKSVPTTIESSQLRLESGSLTRGAVLAASREAGAVVIGNHYQHYFGKRQGATKSIEELLERRFPVRRVVLYGKRKKHKTITVLLRRRPASLPAR
jgi:hypothetical protein